MSKSHLLFVTAGLVAAFIVIQLFQETTGAVANRLRAAEPETVQLADSGQEIASSLQYIRLAAPSDAVVNDALRAIDRGWHPGGAVMLVESSGFAQSKASFANIMKLLRKKTGQNFGNDLSAWYRWVWSQEYQPHPQYAAFKSATYSAIDRRFSEYFIKTDNAKIRLDEIRWGGVHRDGIPPLKNPRMTAASQARYLGDSNIVFGIELNGEARCYPKRILAWHEMFKDTIGGQSVCGAY